MKTNVLNRPKTHEGARAVRIGAEQELRRTIMACLLWEGSFYEGGVDVADRITALVPQVDPEKVAQIASEARNKMKLRHAPLWLAVQMCRHKSHRSQVGKVLADVIQRADETAEFLSLYWKDGKCKLAAQVKRGLAKAFVKFDAYQLGKYNRDGAVKLRDVLFLCHPKPKDDAQQETWNKLTNGTLESPDTWEVALSGGADKKATWERLIAENKLGALALLRNLRNMDQAGVSEATVRNALTTCKTDRVLPFRFIAAAKHAPRFEDALEVCMYRCLAQAEKLTGKTVLILDVSGSMGGRLSDKSEMDRLDAAAGLAILARELCEHPVIYATAGNDCERIHATELLPPRRGFALRDTFRKAARQLGGGGIFLRQVMDFTRDKEKSADRVIVFTDEQDCDQKLNPATAPRWGKANYLVNVANYKNGIGYQDWVHIDGFSETVLDYIRCAEWQQAG